MIEIQKPYISNTNTVTSLEIKTVDLEQDRFELWGSTEVRIF